MSVFHGLRALGGTNSGVLLAANLSTSAVGVLTGVATARALGSVGRGELAILTYWPALVALLVNVGIGDAITLHVARKPQRLRSQVLVGGAVAVVCSGAGIFLGLILLPYLLRSDQHYLLSISYVYLLFIPGSIASALMSGALLGLQKFRALAAIRVTSGLLATAAVVTVALSGAGTPAVFAWLILASTTLPAVMCTVLLVSHLRNAPRMRINARTQVLDGARIHGTRVAAAVASAEDRAVANWALPQSSIGIYQIPAALTYVLPVIPLAISQLLFARLRDSDLKARQEMITTSYVRAILLSTIAAIVAIPLLPFVIPLVYGEVFSRAVGPALIITVSSVFSSGTMVLQSAARAQLSVRPCIYAEIAAIVTVGGISLPLIQLFGLNGLALAYLIGRSTSLVWMLRNTQELFGMPGMQLLPFSANFRRAARSELRDVFSIIIS